MAKLLNSDPYASLTCGVCFGEFDDPRALPCLHTFCLSCLVGVFDANRGALTCPCCREPCCTQPQDLRKDFRIARLQELRPLMEMGLEVLETLAQKAQTLLGNLMPARELRQVTRECDESLRALRQDQVEMDKIFDAYLERCQTVIRDQRAVVRKAIEERRSELQARRRWAVDSLELRSVSELMLQCVGDDSRQSSVQDSVARFRQSSAEPPRPEPKLALEQPTKEAVCTELRAALAQISVADVSGGYARVYQRILDIRSEQASSGDQEEAFGHDPLA